MPDPEYLVIDPAEVLRALKAKGMGGFARTTVLAVLHDKGVPAREESSRYYEASGPRHTRLVTDWQDSPA